MEVVNGVVQVGLRHQGVEGVGDLIPAVLAAQLVEHLQTSSGKHTHHHTSYDFMFYFYTIPI